MWVPRNTALRNIKIVRAIRKITSGVFTKLRKEKHNRFFHPSFVLYELSLPLSAISVWPWFASVSIIFFVGNPPHLPLSMTSQSSSYSSTASQSRAHFRSYFLYWYYILLKLVSYPSICEKSLSPCLRAPKLQNGRVNFCAFHQPNMVAIHQSSLGLEDSCIPGYFLRSSLRIQLLMGIPRRRTTISRSVYQGGCWQSLSNHWLPESPERARSLAFIVTRRLVFPAEVFRDRYGNDETRWAEASALGRNHEVSRSEKIPRDLCSGFLSFSKILMLMLCRLLPLRICLFFMPFPGFIRRETSSIVW